MVSPKLASQNETRDIILDAAQELLSTRGYRRMTMDEVAKQANLGKGTIYLYFDSKDDLALSVIDRINDRLRAKLKSIIRLDISAVERLRRMLVERVLYRLESIRSSSQCIDQLLAHLREQLLERRNSYHEREAVIFMEVLIEGRTRGEVFFEDAHSTAHALLTATTALLPYSLRPNELGNRTTVQNKCEAVVDLLIRGLTNSCAGEARDLLTRENGNSRN